MPPLSKRPPTVLDKPRNDNNRGSVVGLRASPRRDPRAQHRRSSRRPRCPSARRSNSPHACSACSSLARSTRQVKLGKTPPALRLKAAAAPLGSSWGSISAQHFRVLIPSWKKISVRPTEPPTTRFLLFSRRVLVRGNFDAPKSGRKRPPGKGGAIFYFFGEFRARSGGTSGATRERAARAIDRAQDVGGRRGP